MQRVIVQVTTGPATGKRIALALGHTLQVGRTEWADFAVPLDEQMSSVHFAIEIDSSGCYVKDLGSTNGTYLNRRRLKPQERTPVGDGAEIAAGRSVFVIQARGAGIEDATATVRSRPDAPDPAAVRLSKIAPAYVAPTPLAQERWFTAERCNSGLNLCRGRVEEIAPSELAATLASLLPIHLIVDFNKLGKPRPEELTAPNYLFGWMDPQAAAVVSPVIISQDEYLSWPKLIDEGWGHDAVVCLFSQQEKTKLVDHLREALHKGPIEDRINAIVGYCWPAVLSPLLAYSRPQFVQHLLAGIDAVLIELPDLPESWQIFSLSSIDKPLRQFGLREQPAEGRQG